MAAIERLIVADRTKRTYAGSDGIELKDVRAFVEVDAEGTPMYQ